MDSGIGELKNGYFLEGSLDLSKPSKLCVYVTLKNSERIESFVV